MKIVLLGIPACAGLIVLAVVGLRLYGASHVTDWPTMENPFPQEGEPEEIREVSEMAELVEFSWHQGSMSYDYSFDFEIRTTEEAPGVPRLRCDYMDQSTGERVKLGEEDIGFQGYGIDGTRLTEDETWPIVSPERWEELAGFLRKTELSPYSPPPPDLMDAANSRIQVTWRDGGEEFTNSYSGLGAHDLLELLQDIAEEVSTSK